MQVLLEHQAKALLSRYGIPTTPARLATEAAAAAAHARECGGPVAMKIASPDIIHKARANCVRLNVSADDAAEVFAEIVAAAGAVDDARIEGVIVEPAKGDHESPHVFKPFYIHPFPSPRRGVDRGKLYRPFGVLGFALICLRIESIPCRKLRS